MLKNMQKSISSSVNSTITNHLTMQNIIMYLLFFMVVTCHSFFIDSKDFRKLLQIFPKSLEVDSQKVRAGHLRRRDNDYRNRDQQIYDHHDRYDEETSRGKIRNLKKLSGKYEYNNINEKLHHHSHVECDHPDHYHHHHTSKYPEDRNEKKYYKHSDEAVINHEKKHYHEKTRSSPQNDKDLDDKHYEKDTQDKQSNPNYKKDYITGVLVAIPKFKNDDDLEGFYKSKQQTLLLQQLLKGDDDDTRHHQQIPEDEEKSYLY